MNKLKTYDWDKRNRTSLRSIKSGDIFCFALSDQKYGVGRIMTQNSLGHVAEIFDKILTFPDVKSLSFSRLGDPVILDSYSLFDRKLEGDWRIVAHQIDYEPPSEESIKFVYGVANNIKLVDIFDNETDLVGDKDKYPDYSPVGDGEIKGYFNI
ncbi:TPA: Imm26 family immunity protein [Pseudomonas putida]